MVQKLATYATRVVHNDSFRRGMATAAASVIVAGILEAWHPTQS